MILVLKPMVLRYLPYDRWNLQPDSADDVPSWKAPCELVGGAPQVYIDLYAQ